MILSVNDVPVYAGRIALPKLGRWWAELLCVNTDKTFTAGQRVSIAAGDAALSGTIDSNRTGLYDAAFRMRIVSGGNGWLNEVRPAHFAAGHTVRDILRALTGSVGETLSGNADALLLSTGFPAYTILQSRFVDAATVLFDTINEGRATPVSYRFLFDGSFWAGFEGKAASSTDALLQSFEPQVNAALYEPSTLSIQPGQTLQTSDGIVRGVNFVEYEVSQTGIKAHVLFDDA